LLVLDKKNGLRLIVPETIESMLKRPSFLCLHGNIKKIKKILRNLVVHLRPPRQARAGSRDREKKEQNKQQKCSAIFSLFGLVLFEFYVIYVSQSNQSNHCINLQIDPFSSRHHDFFCHAPAV
jgi:hypothetical protein